MKIIEDVTDKYYEIAFGESYYEIEKRLIKNDNEKLMKDIELLEELEFDLRHEYVKIVKIYRDSLYKGE